MTAERRTKAHFRREDEFTVWRLARNWRFGLNESQRLGQPKQIKREQLPKIRLGKDGLVGRRRGGCERRTTGMFVAAVLVRIVRVMIGICGRRSSVVLMLDCTVCMMICTDQGLHRAEAGRSNPDQ